MNPNEPRAIWCVLKDGMPVEWKWALVRTPAEVDLAALPPSVQASKADRAQKIGWASALTAVQAVDPTFDATPSAWRRVPLLAQSGSGGTKTLVGRAVEADGVRYHLDDRGRPHPASQQDAIREPLVPDAVVVDETALVAAAERLGRSLDLVERGTREQVRVLHERPVGAKDEDLATPGVRVLARSRDGRSLTRLG